MTKILKVYSSDFSSIFCYTGEGGGIFLSDHGKKGGFGQAYPQQMAPASFHGLEKQAQINNPHSHPVPFPTNYSNPYVGGPSYPATAGPSYQPPRTHPPPVHHCRHHSQMLVIIPRYIAGYN